MTYPQAVDYLMSTRVFGWKLGLGPVQELLRRLGNPQDQLQFIHIAGTNGKGSVAAMCQAMLTAAGQKTGLYTSPHLVSFCERFQIDGRLIPEAEIVRLVELIKPLSEQVAADPQFRELTFFEVVTAMALVYFRDQRVDVVSWETGLGGRLDATNVVTPRVSVITNIGLDHTQHLGGTIAEIAREKCGIIKPGVPVVTASRSPEALDVIRAVSAERGSPLTVVERPALQTGALRGPHQGWNCATALAALQAAGYQITDEIRDRGLAQVVWPGRFQILAGSPPIVVDGAHNIEATQTLLAALADRFPGRPVRLILGVLRDKPWEELCRVLAPIARMVRCVAVNNARTCDPQDLVRVCRDANPQADVAVAPGFPSALATVRAGAVEDVIVITGSLFLVGEALSHLELPFGETSFRAKELVLQ